jgi:hypothetical protein
VSKSELSFTQFDASSWGYNNDPQMTDQAFTEQMYMTTLSELCVNRFKWEGLPDEIDRRFIELSLHRNGLVVFFHDSDKKDGGKYFDRYFCLKASTEGPVNMYDNPTEFRAYGNQMIERKLNARECVPIWANSLRIPQRQAIAIYSRKLAKIDRTIDITIENLRYTRLVTGNSNQRNSLVNIMRNIDEGKPIVYTTPNFDPASVQVLDLGVHPDLLPKLMDARNSLWNQAMGFLGINNANQDKRERLVASEVQANDEQVLAVRATALNARQYAAEQINLMFPELNVTVTYDQTGAMPTQPDGAGQFDEGTDATTDTKGGE